MTRKEIDDIITAEILSADGFINIDENDVRAVRESSDFIDANASFAAESGPIDARLNEMLDELTSGHKDASLSSLLFVVKLNQDRSLNMSSFSGINSVLATTGDIDIKWGISTDDNIPYGNYRIIIIAGFKDK